MAMRGVYISIDGIDGAGSTTHTKILADWLKSKGLKVLATKEPTLGKIGLLIREYLSKPSLHPAIDALLFAADRVEHSMIISKALNEGVLVISDRSIISSLAYQKAQGLEEEWILEINKYALKPDIPIILDIDPAQSLSRKNTPREKFEELNFLKAVRENLLTMALKNNWKIVDTSRPIDEVASDIRSYVAFKLREHGVNLNEKL